jgi:hypothetical protein
VRPPRSGRCLAADAQRFPEEDEQIRHFAFDAVADGAFSVFCSLSRAMAGPEQVSKTHAPIEAAKQDGRLLADGCTRDQLTNYA